MPSVTRRKRKSPKKPPKDWNALEDRRGTGMPTLLVSVVAKPTAGPFNRGGTMLKVPVGGPASPEQLLPDTQEPQREAASPPQE